MAKEEKKKVDSIEVNEENIVDIINNSSTVTEEIAKEAAETIAKKRKEQVTRELIDAVQQCDYAVQRTVLSVRRSSQVNKRTKTYLKDLSALAEDIKNGKVPVADWTKKSRELRKQFDKDVVEIGKTIDEAASKLNDIFPSSWCWRYSELIPGNN